MVGLRATGSSAVRFLRGRGDDVTVVEDEPGASGYTERRREAEARGALVVEAPPADAWGDLVADRDLVVPSPGVRPGHPVRRAALRAGVSVRGDVDLAVEAARARGVPTVAVTGTNGKTTITTLLRAMLVASGVTAVAAGNIGTPALDALEAFEPGGAGTVLVLEVSSFQLEDTSSSFRPAVAVLANVAPDHLDWHGTFSAYVAAKARVFLSQGPHDVLVYDRDDDGARALARFAPGRTAAVSLNVGRDEHADAVGNAAEAVAGLDDALVVAGSRIDVASGPYAPHERTDVLLAAHAASEVGATSRGIAAALAGGARLHHRVEPVGQAGGVQFYDDSKATNPHATLAALEGFDHVVLIAGGRNKGLDLGALVARRDRLRAVVTIGESAGELRAAFEGVVPVIDADRMDAAVRAAVAVARPGDAVLLSPACASFDQYPSYAARGDDFAAHVAAWCAQGVSA